MSLSSLTCRWVPGTLDRVFVSSPFGSGEASLRDVRRVLGPVASHDLYLSGRHHLCGDADHIWYALVCLGCPVAPGGLAPVAAVHTPAPPSPVPTTPARPGTPRPAGGPL
ncbi:hypothetical protein [Deinococcus planocerae]|uniref:hypothetical protein n=1 Tax=Deinococcus planocerae TaxID=1737569 RepID=UPI0011AF9746|nr:hypothetical protein [Deinococcus planocerae]